MQHEAGDDYIRRIATFIRDNERGLAEAGVGRRRRAHTTPNYSLFNPLGWVGLSDTPASPTPVVLSLDTHHLFYILMRLEALGIDIGTLDVKIDNPTRPLSYVHIELNDKSDTLSIAESFRSSLSVVSRLSLGGGWWGRTETKSIDSELKFIFSVFTRLPAISLHGPGPKMVAELAQDPPGNNAIPMDSFKNLSVLECSDVDPRALLGWDRLSVSLRSLTIKRSGLDDPTSIFVDAVLDDQLRREGDFSRSRARKLAHRSSIGFHSSNLPETVKEEVEEESEQESSIETPTVGKLSPLYWARLKHLSLVDNALTALPTSMFNALTSLSHLDLSSNLLVSVPSLSMLFNLVSLNLSDNMIDSVLGIYKKLGQVLTLNLSRNRLDSLCGLERLMALERVDLRNNSVEESAEVGRLAVLPNISEVWIEGNPFTEVEENYRVRCFDHFWKEGKHILLDGAPASYYERRNLTNMPPEQMYSSRPPSVASPPFAPVSSAQPSATLIGRQSPLLSPAQSASSSAAPSPSLAAVVTKPKKRRNKRIVALDGGDSDYRSSEDNGRVGLHSRATTELRQARSKSPLERSGAKSESIAQASDSLSTIVEPLPTPPLDEPIRRSRHNRYHTEYAPPSPSAEISASSLGSTRNLGRKSGTVSSSSKRRHRVSASLYEPPSGAGGNDDEESPIAKQMNDADAFRARIEALRAEMGDNWLQVLSQSQFRTDQPKR